MNPNCPICRGIGSLYENHSEKPWDPELGCVCGAGAPCKCNETNGVDEPYVSQLIGEDEPKRHRGSTPVGHYAAVDDNSNGMAGRSWRAGF